MAALRIFSYLPNPRIWKATIAARLCGVEVEVRGASPSDLSQWLWDFDARPIADVPPDVLSATEHTGRIGFTDRKLYKTAAFLEAQRLAPCRPLSVPTARPAFSNRTASCALLPASVKGVFRYTAAMRMKRRESIASSTRVSSSRATRRFICCL